MIPSSHFWEHEKPTGFQLLSAYKEAQSLFELCSCFHWKHLAHLFFTVSLPHCFEVTLQPGTSIVWNCFGLTEEKWVVLEESHATLHKPANDQMTMALNKELKEMSQTTQGNSFIYKWGSHDKAWGPGEGEAVYLRSQRGRTCTIWFLLRGISASKHTLNLWRSPPDLWKCTRFDFASDWSVSHQPVNATEHLPPNAVPGMELWLWIRGFL